MTTQADGIHSDEPGQADQIGGCSCGARFYSFEVADNHADECPLPDDRDLPADTIASHLRNLQQLIELRTERPTAITGGFRGKFAAHVFFVGEELDAVNARIAKALALAEQGEKDTARLDWLEREKAVISPYNEPEPGKVWCIAFDSEFSRTGNERDGNTVREAIDAARLAEQVTT